jgi:hypothetical protein
MIPVLTLVALSAGCAKPWLYARAAITTARTGLDTAEPLIPEDAPDRDRGLALARASLDAGELAADIWEREGDPDTTPTGWGKWVGDALRGLAIVIDVLKAAGVSLPPQLLLAAGALDALAPAIGDWLDG